MSISNVTVSGKTSAVSANVTASDIESKRLQSQIASKQQRLNSLASDDEISAEEKAKQRQEIKEQIAELNRKLELKRQEKEAEEKKAAKEAEDRAVVREDMLNGVKKDESKKTEDGNVIDSQDKEFSVKNIHNILSANSLVNKERVQESVARQKEGYENVLESEIKLDKMHGEDTEEKEDKLKASIRSQDILVKSADSDLAAAGVQVGGKIIIRE
ncbi:MAG: FlxA-like family protein [Lachnospira sp.]|nr:FlxA-like family protein [Lachnospira sp.]